MPLPQQNVSTRISCADVKLSMKLKELDRYHTTSSRQIQTIAKEKNRIPLATLVLG